MQTSNQPQTTNNSKDRDASVQISRTEHLAIFALQGMNAAQSLKKGDFFGGAFWHGDKAGITRWTEEWDAFVQGFVAALPKDIYINNAGIITHLQ